MDTLVLVERVDFGRHITVRLALRDYDSDRPVKVARPVVFEEQDIDQVVVEPMLKLRQEAAQRLMDELWRAGLRPSEGSGSAGSLAATERHLADMKAIAFGLLKGEF